jgi:flagellar M-ring protein FliF
MADSALKLTQLPAVRQALVLLTVAGAVAAGIGLYSWSQQPAWTPLFANLADKDGAEVAEALRGAAIPFRLDPSGTVSVPEGQLYDARLKLAAQGLPQGASAGFEMMREPQGFGVSPLVENARYQHALETELTRTIASLRPVQNARVHLALPKATAFARAQAAASASVLVQLYPGRTLDPVQVASIVHLVASSIPDLKPGAVTVIDQSGRLLTGSGGEGDLALTATQFDLLRRMEEGYVRRIEDLLRPMVGAGRVSAQVSADLDFTVTEEAREVYAPDPAKVRSEQIASQGTVGVPGAASNQPVAPAAAPAGAAVAAAGQQSRSETRNYELDKTLTHTRQPSGRLRRLSVAVLVDHLPKVDKGKTTWEPLGEAQLEQVRALVKEAVGFSEARGDTLSIMNASFHRETELPPAAAVPLWERPAVLDWARRGLGGLLVLVIAFAVLRPALRELTTIRAPAALAAPAGAEAAVLAGPRAGGALPYEEKLALARGAVAQDPKKVAQVVRNWVGSDA